MGSFTMPFPPDQAHSLGGPRRQTTPFQPRRKWSAEDKQKFTTGMSSREQALILQWNLRSADYHSLDEQFTSAGDWLLQDLLPAISAELTLLFPWNAAVRRDPSLPTRWLELLNLSKKFLALCGAAASSAAASEEPVQGSGTPAFDPRPEDREVFLKFRR